jgi:hypothetical protein
MPVVSLTDLAGKSVKANVAIDDLNFDAWYFPRRITSGMIRDAQAAADIRAEAAQLDTAETLRRVEAAAEILCAVVDRWELIQYWNPDGTPGPAVPLEREAIIRMVGMVLAWEIVGALMSGVRLGETSGTPSKRPSSRSSRRVKRDSSATRA